MEQTVALLREKTKEDWTEKHRNVGVLSRPWNWSYFSMKKWESEMHKSWCMLAEGFKGHVAIDGSLLGTAGK